MSWTDERVEILTKMWAEGNSASQIAKELGGVTRTQSLVKFTALVYLIEQQQIQPINLIPKLRPLPKAAPKQNKKHVKLKLRNKKRTTLLH